MKVDLEDKVIKEVQQRFSAKVAQEKANRLIKSKQLSKKAVGQGEHAQPQGYST